MQTVHASLGPSTGLVAFDMSELMLQSQCWSHRDNHIKVLAAGLRHKQMVTRDQPRRRANSLWAMVGLARSWPWDTFFASFVRIPPNV